MDDWTRLAREAGPAFLASVLVTWRLAFLSFAAGFSGGLVLSLLRLLHVRPLRAAVDLYVEVFRNIPGAALLILIVFALPYLQVVFDYEPSVILTLALISAAFTVDNLRTGINTVDPGQVEAAYSLGLGPVRTIVLVVLPQALRTVVQPMTSLLIAVMLSTALASQVPVTDRELTGLVDKITNDTAAGILPFAAAALFYVATGLALGALGGWLDRRLRVVR